MGSKSGIDGVLDVAVVSGGGGSAANVGTANVTAPTSANEVGGVDSSGKLQALTAALFHNADGQTFTGTSFGILTGGVAQLLNGTGTLDRARSANSDGQAATGIAAGGGMLFNGSTWDRNRSATGDGLAVTGIQGAADLLWNGASFDRPRSASAANATTGTGVDACGALGVYNSVAPTYAAGQYGNLQLDAAGNLKMVLGASATFILGGVYAKATTSGGMSSSKIASGFNGVAKASTGQLYSYELYNTQATVRYLQLYASTTAVAAGGTPVITIPIPATSRSALSTDIGWAIASGIAWGLTTDAAGATQGASGDVAGTLGYL